MGARTRGGDFLWGLMRCSDCILKLILVRAHCMRKRSRLRQAVHELRLGRTCSTRYHARVSACPVHVHRHLRRHLTHWRWLLLGHPKPLMHVIHITLRIHNQTGIDDIWRHSAQLSRTPLAHLRLRGNASDVDSNLGLLYHVGIERHRRIARHATHMRRAGPTRHSAPRRTHHWLTALALS